jgi:membrane protein YqaA with SNARE-associated domain
MLYLLTFLWSIPSPIVWVMNAEAWTIIQASKGADPLLLATFATLGQTVCFVSLFYGGEWVLRRLPRLRAKLEKFDVEKYRSWSYLALGLASVAGVPPLVLMALLAKTLHYRFPVFLFFTVVGRFARFLVLAFAPDTFRAMFGAVTGGV